jgi:hypothetical protein
VLEKLETSGYLSRIDEILVADERDPQSPGMQLARQYQVDRAPFFVVEEDQQEPKIYTVYFKFVKEVLEKDDGAGPGNKHDETEELKEILRDNPDLDFL